MIIVIDYPGALGIRLQKFTCVCGKLHKWKPDTQQSPFICLAGCNIVLPDVTKLTKASGCRVAYHLGGEGAIKCGGSL